MDEERAKFLRGYSYCKNGGRLSVLKNRGFGAELAGFDAAKQGKERDGAVAEYLRSSAIQTRRSAEVDENGFVLGA